MTRPTRPALSALLGLVVGLATGVHGVHAQIAPAPPPPENGGPTPLPPRTVELRNQTAEPRTLRLRYGRWYCLPQTVTVPAQGAASHRLCMQRASIRIDGNPAAAPPAVIEARRCYAIAWWPSLSPPRWALDTCPG